MKGCGRKIGPFDCCTIVVGDCLDVMAEMPDSCIDAIVTDPPFKLSQTYSSNVDADNLLAVSSIWPASAQMYRIANKGAIAAIFYDMRILPLALTAIRYARWQYLRGLTFYRRWGNAHKLYGWMSTSDFILIFTKPGAKFEFYDAWKHDVYVKSGPEDRGPIHPAQKPIAFVNHLVSHITPHSGIVFDSYIGAGTTAVSAKQSSRHFFGCDTKAEYVEMAKKELSTVQLGMNL